MTRRVSHTCPARSRLGRLLSAFLVLGVLALPARAQTIEYEIPTSYELESGRLSVTFADTVTEASAVALLGAVGLAVDSVSFSAVRVTASVQRLPADTIRARLETFPGLVEVQPRAASSEAALVFLVDRALSDARIRRAVDSVSDLTLTSIERRPGEAIVRVPPDREEELAERLNALPAVRYVAFLVVQ